MEYISKYRKILMAENQRYNLVSRRMLEEDFDKHVQDSLEILNYAVGWDNCKIADMGSGAGFPGLILAMRYPGTQFTLVESNQKKSAFLRRAAEQLNLGNVTIAVCRLEEAGRGEFRESFDVVTARALAALNILLEYGMPLLKTGGTAWFWKGIKAAEEVKLAQPALAQMRASVDSIYWYRLAEDRDRALVKVSKQGPTPAQYPRRTGVPLKRPL